MPKPIPTATASEFTAWIFRKRKRLRIRGASMEPTLAPGDVVFVDTEAYATAPPADDDVVVATHPNEPGLQIIKRVQFTEDNAAYLASDNLTDDRATDSRRFGMVRFDLIIGKVTATVPAKR